VAVWLNPEPYIKYSAGKQKNLWNPLGEDDDLLEPCIDPKKRAIGIRKVSAVNEASTGSGPISTGSS
jgi:hypothetical protein